MEPHVVKIQACTSFIKLYSIDKGPPRLRLLKSIPITTKIIPIIKGIVTPIIAFLENFFHLQQYIKKIVYFTKMYINYLNVPEMV